MTRNLPPVPRTSLKFRKKCYNININTNINSTNNDNNNNNNNHNNTNKLYLGIVIHEIKHLYTV